MTHLRVIYEHLAKSLAKTGRDRWVAEELSVLTDPETYITRPDEAWKRVRTRSNSPRFLAVVRELARFREDHAQSRNIPRSRVFKDDALLELASSRPTSPEELGRSRLLLREARRGDIAEGILAAVKIAMALPNDALPRPEAGNDRPAQGNPALSDLLRVLLKARSDAENVAAKLIATASDLDAIAAGARDLPALKGWRREAFGADALRLCEGKIALSAKGGQIRVVPL